jgi:hypothetical protein
VRLAAAYADLLAAQGEEELAGAWLAAIAAADPDNLTGAVDHPGIEFIDLEEEFEGDVDDDTVVESDAPLEAEVSPVDFVAPPAPEVVDELPEDTHGLGQSFDDEVETEVAELLGEIETPAASQRSSTDDAQH